MLSQWEFWFVFLTSFGGLGVILLLAYMMRKPEKPRR